MGPESHNTISFHKGKRFVRLRTLLTDMPQHDKMLVTYTPRSLSTLVVSRRVLSSTYVTETSFCFRVIHIALLISLFRFQNPLSLSFHGDMAQQIIEDRRKGTSNEHRPQRRLTKSLILFISVSVSPSSIWLNNQFHCSLFWIKEYNW